MSTTRTEHPVRGALRTSGALGLSLVLTVAVVMLVANLMDAWT